MTRIATVAIAALLGAAAPVSADWSGAYAGGTMSYAHLGYALDDGGSPEAQGYLTGLHAGVQRDLGRVVLGAELEHHWGNVHFDGADEGEVERALRAKLRLGFDAGRFLPYAALGLARAYAEDQPPRDARVWGAGLDLRLGDRATLGIELLRHRFDGVDLVDPRASLAAGEAASDAEAALTTLGLRWSLRF